jgi:four helix bundle protein
MTIKGFQSALAWQKAMDLNVAVDEALTGSRNFAFRDQLFRAALSISNNIAEGYEMPTLRNQLKYLWIAKGSCNEVESMLILAQRRGYFNDVQTLAMLGLQDEIARLLRSYIDHKASAWRRVPGGTILVVGLCLAMSFWALR